MSRQSIKYMVKVPLGALKAPAKKIYYTLMIVLLNLTNADACPAECR
jgi:hypothetical protein